MFAYANINEFNIPDLPPGVLFIRHRWQPILKAYVDKQKQSKARGGTGGDPGAEEETEAENKSDDAEKVEGTTDKDTTEDDQDPFAVPGRPDLTSNLYEAIPEDTGEELPKHNAAVKLIRLLQFQWHGKVVTQPALKASSRLLRSQ